MLNMTWLSFLPNAVRTRIVARPGVRQALDNIAWQIMDKIVRLGLGLIIMVWLARYLGPSEFGILSYVLAFAAVFATLASLGLDSVVIRELVANAGAREEILGTTFVIKFASGALMVPLAVLCIYMLRPNLPQLHLFVAILVGATAFLSFDVIDYWFQARVQTKYIVLARSAAFSICAALRIAMILWLAPLTAFVILAAIDTVLMGISLAAVYRINVGPIKAWRFSTARAKLLIDDSWPLMLSALAIMIYMKVDQVMIGQMLDDKAVGIYAAAVRLVEIWYVIPMLIATTIFPTLYRTRQEDRSRYLARLQHFIDLMAVVAFVIAISVTLTAEILLEWLFGHEFAEAASVLRIYAWSLVFLFLLVGTGQYLIAENKTRFAFARNLAGMVVNVSLNAVLIPLYGIEGAAWASLAGYAVAAYAVNLLNTEMRQIFVMQTKAMMFPMAALRLYEKFKMLR